MRGKTANKKMIDGIWHKQCSICGNYFPLTPDYFYRHKNNGRGDGFRAVCKQCSDKQNAKGSKRYAKKLYSIDRKVVYFVLFSELNAIKIGFTKNIVKRFRELKVAIPGNLTVLGTIEGGVKLERKIQQSFKNHLIRGEWYQAVDGLLAYIEEFAEPLSLEEKRRIGLNETLRSLTYTNQKER